MSDTNGHNLSLSYQIRRAIKAEDALQVAQTEIENLNGLLNATYVSREAKEKQYDEALCTVAEQRDTMKLRIRQHMANRYAYTFKEFCENLEEILYAAPIPQPNTEPAMLKLPEPFRKQGQQLCNDGNTKLFFDAYNSAQMHDAYRQGLAAQQAQPERAPLSDAELEQEFCNIAGLETGINPAAADTKRALVWFKKGYAHGIKQGGQHD